MNPYHYEYGDDVLPHPISEEVPRFFKRVVQPLQKPDNAPDFYVDLRWLLDAPLTTYGYAIQSPYTEDQYHEKHKWEEEKIIHVAAFSNACTGGELGWVQLSDIEAITEDEFHAAHARGWESEEE